MPISACRNVEVYQAPSIGRPSEGAWYTSTFRHALIGMTERRGVPGALNRQAERAAELVAKLRVLRGLVGAAHADFEAEMIGARLQNKALGHLDALNDGGELDEVVGVLSL